MKMVFQIPPASKIPAFYKLLQVQNAVTSGFYLGSAYQLPGSGHQKQYLLVYASRTPERWQYEQPFCPRRAGGSAERFCNLPERGDLAQESQGGSQLVVWVWSSPRTPMCQQDAGCQKIPEFEFLTYLC